MGASNNKTVDVYIECDETSCRVRPGEIDVVDQNKVRFHNKTTGIVAIVFSEESLFAVSNTKIDPDKDKDLTVQKVQRGIYPYAVYCEAISDFASASSMPIIIVRR